MIPPDRFPIERTEPGESFAVASGGHSGRSAQRHPDQSGRRHAPQGVRGAAIVAALLVENAERCRPAAPGGEVASIARSVCRYAPTASGLRSTRDPRARLRRVRRRQGGGAMTDAPPTRRRSGRSPWTTCSPWSCPSSTTSWRRSCPPTRPGCSPGGRSQAKGSCPRLVRLRRPGRAVPGPGRQGRTGHLLRGRGEHPRRAHAGGGADRGTAATPRSTSCPSTARPTTGCNWRIRSACSGCGAWSRPSSRDWSCSTRCGSCTPRRRTAATRWGRCCARCASWPTRPGPPSSSTTTRTGAGPSAAAPPSAPPSTWSGPSPAPTATTRRATPRARSRSRGGTGRARILKVRLGPGLRWELDETVVAPRDPGTRERILAHLDERQHWQTAEEIAAGTGHQAQDHPERAGGDAQGDPAAVRDPGDRGQERPAAVPHAAPRASTDSGRMAAEEMIPPDPSL